MPPTPTPAAPAPWRPGPAPSLTPRTAAPPPLEMPLIALADAPVSVFLTMKRLVLMLPVSVVLPLQLFDRPISTFAPQAARASPAPVAAVARPTASAVRTTMARRREGS